MGAYNKLPRDIQMLSLPCSQTHIDVNAKVIKSVK